MNELEKKFEELRLKDPRLDKYSFLCGMVFLSGIVEARDESNSYSAYNLILKQAQELVNRFPRNNWFQHSHSNN